MRLKVKGIHPEHFTDGDLEAFEDVYNKINLRTSYGIRRELADKKSTILHWSNGEESWIVGRTVDAGNEVRLDANEVLAPYSPVRLQRIAMTLPPLPLFAGSSEAKERGYVTTKEGSEAWLKGQMNRLIEDFTGEVYR